MLQLYTHPFSTFGRRAHIAILEKGIAAEIVTVDLPKRAQREEAYLAIHPYGRVPALKNGDFVLAESTPILEYLEAKHPDMPLLPESPEDRALVAMHMKLCDIEFAGPGHPIVFAKRFVPRDKWRMDDITRGQKQITRHYGILSRQLGDKEFLVADKFTLAEVCYMPFLHFSDLLEVEMPDNLVAYKDRLMGRSSAVDTVPPM